MSNLQVVIVLVAAWLIWGERPSARQAAGRPHRARRHRAHLGRPRRRRVSAATPSPGRSSASSWPSRTPPTCCSSARVATSDTPPARSSTPRSPVRLTGRRWPGSSAAAWTSCPSCRVTPGCMLLAVSAQVAGSVLIAVALPRLPAATTSLILLVQPVLAVLLAMVLLDETPSPLQLLWRRPRHRRRPARIGDPCARRRSSEPGRARPCAPRGVSAATMDGPMQTSYRNLTCADARLEHAGTLGHARRLGQPPPRHGPAHLPRPARPLRHHPGRRRRDGVARRPRRRVGRRAASSCCGCSGTDRGAPAGHGEPPTRHRRRGAARQRDRGARRSAHAALRHQRARRRDRRGAAPQVPLPRPAPRAAAAAHPHPRTPRAGHPRGPSRGRLRRGRDAAAHQVHAGGRARLHRALAPPARQRLRPAAEPAAAQAAAHGQRHSTATSRSRAACATRTCAATASRSSRSSTSR